MKKFLSILLSLCFVFAMIPAVALAEGETSGAATETINWSWDAATTTLTFTGTGAMTDYTSGNYTTSPWFAYAKTVTKIVIGEGITSTGKYAFSYHDNLAEAYLPSTLRVLSNATFNCCKLLTKCDLPEGLVEMGRNCINATMIETINIPSTLTTIQGLYSTEGLTGRYSSFRYPMGTKAYTVAEGSQTFCAVDGVLFTKGMVDLVAYPIADSTRTSYEIPYGVANISIYSFFDADHLGTVYIPATVVNMCSTIFNSASELHNIYFYGDAPAFGDDIFDCGQNYGYINVYHLEGAVGFVYNATFDWYLDNMGMAFVVFEDDGRYPVVNPVVVGDANDDGEVGLTDALLILRSVAGWTVTMNEEAADVNGDGSVGQLDAMLILRHLAGWNVEQLA